MDIANQPNDSCRSFFINGDSPTVEAYTKVWIRLINEIEKRKKQCSGHADEYTKRD